MCTLAQRCGHDDDAPQDHRPITGRNQEDPPRGGRSAGDRTGLPGRDVAHTEIGVRGRHRAIRAVDERVRIVLKWTGVYVHFIYILYISIYNIRDRLSVHACSAGCWGMGGCTIL